jgi:hypothetical protein
MSIGEMVRAELENNRRRYDARANDFFIIAAAKGAITRIEIREVIDELAREGKLIYAPAVSAALAAAKARHKHYNFDAVAFDHRILDKAEEIKFDITNATDLGDVCEWLIENENIPLSAYGLEAQEQQALAAKINAIIARITKGKDVFPRWSGAHGKVVDVSSSTLLKLTVPELIAIDKEVAELRARRAGTGDQQKEKLHEFANSRREGYLPDGTKIIGFENRPKLDSLDAAPIRPYSSDKESPIAGRTDLRSYKENARVTTDASAYGTAVDPFIAPSGKEYTKREIYGIAKNDLALFRRLMKVNSVRLNRILGN